MDFVLWASRVMHVISVVVWIGGLIFLNAIVTPVVEHEQAQRSEVALGIQKRFLPFIWSSLWSLLLTGALLMVLSPRFLWFDYSTLWSKLLAVKQISFLLLGFFSWQTAKVFARMERSLNEDEFNGWQLAFKKLMRRSIFFGIIALLTSAGMAVV